MKNFVIILYLLSLSFFTSCNKKTEVSGYVYDKNNVRISGAQINLITYASSKYAESKSHVATSDGNGYYSFNFKTKRNRSYWIYCKGDSGKTNTEQIPAGKVNIIDFKLP